MGLIEGLMLYFAGVPKAREKAQEIAQKLLGIQDKISEGTASREEIDQYHIWQPFLVPIEPITVEKVLLGLVLAKYMQSEGGRGQLAEIAKKYLDVVSRTMTALAAAGASHPLASLIHGRITISVYETLGLIQPEMARVLHSNFEDNINKIIMEKYLADVMGGLGEIVPG